MDALSLLVIMFGGLWLFLPAMVPNSVAAFLGGGPTIDSGRVWRGRRIFGDGKTWRGLFGGAAGGIFMGAVLVLLALLFGSKDYWGYGPFWSNVGVIVCLSFGAILGDLMGAFVKRRFRLERGAKAPILDQYDFVFGAFLVTAVFFPDWVYSTYFEGWNLAAFIFLILVMFFIHRAVNIIGYRIGVKNEPW